MLVSELRKASSGRVTVCLDSGEEILSTSGVVADERLFTGCELDEEALSRFKRASERALMLEYAAGLLSVRRYSEKEIRDKLTKKGASADAADYCVEKLRDYRLLDDEAYADAVVRHYSAKGFGAGRIRAELRRRGVDRELRDEAVEKMPRNEEKLDKFISSRLRDPSDREQLRKITNALYRRGYSWDEIRSAMTRFTSLTGDE